MPTNWVNEVIGLAAVSQPSETPTSADWENLERELNLRFPKDFKTLVSSLGTGNFGVGLRLRNPCASSKYIRLSRATLNEYAQMSARAAQASHIVLYPHTDGAVVIGGMDHQDFLLCPGTPGELLSRLVWWDLDAEKVMDIGMSVSQFIHDLYLGLIPLKWAKELQHYFWRAGTAPFFKPWSGP